MLIGSIFQGQETYLFLLFAAIITIFLVLDLGVFNKVPHKVTTKSALNQSIFWITVSCGFGYLIYLYDGGSAHTLEFFSAYVTEYALSVDNIFVILLILKYFQVKEEYYHNVLFWGILGAIVFRAIFIFLGALLIAQFHWILYIFGVFLVYTGVKIMFEKSDEEIDPEKNPIIKFARKYFKITTNDHGGRFMVKENGVRLFTPLFLVILLIETTDLIFAVDSIPAAFAISQSEFILYTSNIFAILGLRAKFFLLSGVIDKFHLLQKALSFILIFIGAKMLLEIVHVVVPIGLSFSIIFITFFAAIVLSLLFPKKDGDITAPVPVKAGAETEEAPKA